MEKEKNRKKEHSFWTVFQTLGSGVDRKTRKPSNALTEVVIKLFGLPWNEMGKNQYSHYRPYLSKDCYDQIPFLSGGNNIRKRLSSMRLTRLRSIPNQRFQYPRRQQWYGKIDRSCPCTTIHCFMRHDLSRPKATLKEGLYGMKAMSLNPSLIRPQYHQIRLTSHKSRLRLQLAPLREV